MTPVLHRYSTVDTGDLIAHGAVADTGVKIRIESTDRPSGAVYITNSKVNASSMGIVKRCVSIKPRSAGSCDMSSGTSLTAISTALTVQRRDRRATAIGI